MGQNTEVLLVIDSPVLQGFLERTYDETIDALVDLRDFVASELQEARSGLSSDQRVLTVQEITRATRRMASVMAWIMLQKAVHSGELDAEAAAEHEAGQLIREEDDPGSASAEELRALPMAVRSLIDRTRRIYQKASRLDEKARLSRAQ